MLALFMSPGALLAAAAIIIGTTVFPNPYVVFLGFAIALINITNVVSGVLGTQSGIPAELANLISGILTVCFGLAAWSWYAGRDTP
jgi:hypothetical protein